MKFKNIIFFIVFGLFVIEPTKVKSTDIVSDILGTALEQSKKSKLERQKWGIQKKKDLVGLKSKEIKSLVTGNIIFSEWNDNQIKGKAEDIFYEDGSFEAVLLGKFIDSGKKASMKEKGTWSVKQGKLCFNTIQVIDNKEYESAGCVKVLKSKTNPNVYFLRARGIMHQKFVKIISIKDKIEEERIAKEKKEEEERKAEEKRIAEARKAEEKRIAEEEKRIAEEEKKKQEEDAKLQKKLKLFPQRSELEKAQHFLEHVEIFISKRPDEFDIVKISEFLILTKPITKNIFGEKQKNDLALFKDFTSKSKDFTNYYFHINKKEQLNKLEEIDSLYAELEFIKEELKTKLTSNPKLTKAAQHIKDIDIILQNPESIKQLTEYKVRANQYIDRLDREENKLNSELDQARINLSDLKEKLKEDLTSDLAPLIIEQVKLLEKAIEKENFKDLVLANKNATEFMLKNWLEAERKKAEEERIAEEEELAKREEEEKREAEQEKKDEEKRRAQRIDLFCTYIMPEGIRNHTWGYDGKYFFIDGGKVELGVTETDPMGIVATVREKGRNKFLFDVDQYMPGAQNESPPMMSMDVYIDFNKNSSYIDFRTLITGPSEIRGQCIPQ